MKQVKNYLFILIVLSLFSCVSSTDKNIEKLYETVDFYETKRLRYMTSKDDGFVHDSASEEAIETTEISQFQPTEKPINYKIILVKVLSNDIKLHNTKIRN